jgi:hypothetical protein
MDNLRFLSYLLGFCLLLGGGCQPSASHSGIELSSLSADTSQLTPFVEDGRWGFLDSTGRVVLKPRFWNAGAFAEGLAAVREGGLYGYIDAQGRYVLPPAYEFATEFVSGRALVWNAGRPWLIDRNGRALTPPGAYRNLEWEAAEPGRPLHILAYGANDHQGVLDANGRILVDTVYNFVQYLGAGTFEVRMEPWVRERRNEDNPADTTTYLTRGNVSLAILDSKGRVVVPFGRYDRVQPFTDGRALASLPLPTPETDYSDSHLLDTLGHVVATIPGKRYFTYDDSFQDGVLVTSRRAFAGNATNLDDYPAVLDQQGRLLFADSLLESLSPYCNGLAWAETKTREWYLVDKKGHRLNRKPLGQPVGPNFGNEVPPAFANGVEVVRVDSARVQLLTPQGRPAGPPRRLPFAYSDVLREGEMLRFNTSTKLPNGEYETRYGYWQLGTGLIVPPRFQRIGSTYYRGVLPVVLNNRQAYLNRAGQLLWQQPAPLPARLRCNSDIMNRARYTVSSPAIQRYRSAGGWAASGNHARRLPGAPATAGKLRVSVDLATHDTLYGRPFAGHRLCISNSTSDTIVFDGQDSMLDLILQAQDPTGSWRDIEYLPRSFCGNSYHTLFLAPGEYWQVAVPAYEGSQRTRLRAKLTPRNRNNGRAPKVWYSNEFAGSVNPAQFWREPRLAFSGNIMNPYLN